MSTALLALRMLLAAVLAVAGIAKLRDLDGSRRAVQDFGIPTRAAAAVALLLPLAELATAAALVPTASARWGAVAALLLLVAFMVGIGNALRRGETPDCHCFGQIYSAPAGPRTLARNAALAAIAATVVVGGPGTSVSGWAEARTAAELVAVGTTVCAVVFGLAALRLWRERRGLLQQLARATKQAVAAPPGIPIGSPAPGFRLPTLRGETVAFSALRDRGRPILLVFVSPYCESCVELLPKIARWQATLAERLTIALISSGSVKDNQHIAEEHGVEDVLLQEGFEVSDAYRIRGTPSAVIVASDGTIASNPAETVFGIEPLLRLALRDGAGSRVERTMSSP